MKSNRIGFPAIIPDNEDTYIKHLEGVVESVDGDSVMQITKASSFLHVRIAPSSTEVINRIVDSLNRVHNNLGMKLIYSKSMKTNLTVSFSLEIL